MSELRMAALAAAELLDELSGVLVRANRAKAAARAALAAAVLRQAIDGDTERSFELVQHLRKVVDGLRCSYDLAGNPHDDPIHGASLLLSVAERCADEAKL